MEKVQNRKENVKVKRIFFSLTLCSLKSTLRPILIPINYIKKNINSVESSRSCLTIVTQFLHIRSMIFYLIQKVYFQ